MCKLFYGNLILKNEEIAKTFNDYFGSIVENLNLHYWEDKNSVPSNSSNKINDIIENFENHPSIYNIKTKYRGISKFSFQPVTIEEVKNMVRALKTNKFKQELKNLGNIAWCVDKVYFTIIFRFFL